MAGCGPAAQDMATAVDRRVGGANGNVNVRNNGERWTFALGKIVMYGVVMWAVATMLGGYDPSRIVHAKIKEAHHNSRINASGGSSSASTAATRNQARGSRMPGRNVSSSLMPLAREGDVFTLRIECSEPGVFEPVVFWSLPFHYGALSKADYHVHSAVNLSTVHAHNISASVLLSWTLRNHSFTHQVPLLSYFPSTQTMHKRYLLAGRRGDGANRSGAVADSASSTAAPHDADIGPSEENVTAESVAYTAYVQPEFAVSPVIYFETPIQEPFLPFTPRVPNTSLYGPAVVVNNFWLLREHMNEVNASSAQRLLNVTFRVTPLQGWKMMMYTQLNQSFRQQQDMGIVKPSDIDDMKRIFLDNNPYFLLLTFVVSVLHMLFEYLAFANDVKFWRGRKDLRGFSVRSIVMNCYFQTIIFLYLLDTKETSWSILMPSGIGVLMEYWKLAQTMGVRRVTDVAAHAPHEASARQADESAINDREGRGRRVVRDILQQHSESNSHGARDGLRVGNYVLYFNSSYDRRTRVHDDTAVRYLIYAMIPILAGYSVYSALYDTHTSWYGYVIHTQVRFIYFFGFAMMTPQIFINYKLKSVGNLPWRTFVYKALNTVIDDLFAFVVKMPWLHRLACFRDDVVFVILLYQRWIYPVDAHRSAESEGDAAAVEDEDENENDEVNAAITSGYDTLHDTSERVKKAQ